MEPSISDFSDKGKMTGAIWEIGARDMCIHIYALFCNDGDGNSEKNQFAWREHWEHPSARELAKSIIRSFHGGGVIIDMIMLCTS
jgi:hypothetical protein